MSSKKLKVPSSARRHIKIEQFTQFVSSSRLRHIQNIVSQNDDIDGILAIAGIDSRYNEGCLELLNYLLFGFFDLRRDELEKSGFAEEVIDDLIVLVCERSVEVYCNPVNYHYLLPYLSHWPAVQFHCLSEEEFDGEDDDLSEEFKIKSFIGMMANCSGIGIPYFSKGSAHGSASVFNVMAIEKWPIVQAFALEDFGGGGFFTLKHEVKDISGDLHSVYKYEDPVTMEAILTERLPLMTRQWDNVMKCVHIAMNETRATTIPIRKFAEPLRSYFEHGLVQRGRNGKMPFVLINSEANRQQLEEVQTHGTGEQGDVELQSESVHTLIVQAVSPHSPLICARTYFLSRGPYIINTGADGDSGHLDPSHLELRYFVAVYLAMVHAVLAAIERYSHTSSVDKARKVLMSDLIEGCVQVDTPQLSQYLGDSSDIVFTLESIGVDNRGEPLTEGQYLPIMKHISLTLHNIPPPPNCDTGRRTLVFSETFLDSRLFVKDCPDVGSDFFIFTSCLPRYHLSSVSGQSKMRSAPDLPADQWGDFLMRHEDIQMTTPWPALLPPEKVTLSVWENGLAVESQTYGAFVIHGSQMKAVSLYDGNSMTQVSLLCVTVRPNATLRGQLPPHLQVDFEQTGQCQVLLGVTPHSKAHTHMYGRVLPSWKENEDMPEVERPEFLDGDLWPVHSFLQHKLDSMTKGVETPMKKVASTNSELFDYLSHLSVTSCLQQPVNREVFTRLTDDCPPSANIDKIIVTVISGTPGSEKEKLATQLTTYNTNIINWLVYKQSEECRVDVNFLHQSMTTTVQTRDQQSHDSSQLNKTIRVILIAPGFCDTSAVVAGMRSHPNKRIRSEFVIGAVTVCIDPRNFFMDHKFTLPGVTSQLCQGWVNNIVFTSQTLAPSEVLDKIQTLVRSINSNVALLKAENGEVKRSTDLDLIMSETAFQDTEFVRARLLMKPVSLAGVPQVWPGNPEVSDVMIRFTQPLEKHLTLIKLRNIKAGLKGHPFDGNIYFVRGYLEFTGNHKTFDLQFTPLSGKLNLTESTTQRGPGESAINIIAFTGVRLREAELKTLLTACVKQKPEKKNYLKRSDLTQKDIDKIHTQHHLEACPEGWFYNGSRFVSMTGERSVTHPALEDFIQEYLNKKNADVDRFNRRVETEEYVKLFP